MVQARAQLALGFSQEAESTLREALTHLRRAFNWSDRDPHVLHELHSLGREIHDRFSCKLASSEGRYQIECPVRLAHIPLGLSLGGSSRSICSICGEDPFDCNHLRGRSYDRVRAMRTGSACNICHQSECQHNVGEEYDGVEAVHIVSDLKVDEISLVPKPAMPDATFLSLSIPERDIRDQLPDEEADSYEPGMQLYCHHCELCPA